MGQVTSTYESVTCSLGSPTSVYWSNQVQSRMCQTVNNCENLLLIFGQIFSMLCQQERVIPNTILIGHCFCTLKQQYIETECPNSVQTSADSRFCDWLTENMDSFGML